MDLNRKALLAILRKDFRSFLKKAFPVVTGGQRLIDNFHIELMAKEAQDIFSGENKRLIVNIPPRSMKSICFSVALPAFILGHAPSAKIICISYSQELADDLSHQAMALMESQFYQETFPRTKIAKNAKKKNDFKTTKQGGRFATSIDGTLTGRGADFIIVDDPLKPGEAHSELRLQRVNNWFGNTLLSRLDDPKNGAIVVVMQRLHENDLTGYLLEGESSWKHIKIPAIAIEDEGWVVGNKTFERKKGELLHPDRVSQDELDEILGNVGEYIFASQYQQEPSPLDGGIVKRDLLKYYDEGELPTKPDCTLMSWDTAYKTGETNSYSVCTTWFICSDEPRKYYLKDLFRGKLEYSELLNKAIEDYRSLEWHYDGIPLIVLVEEKASGISLIQDLFKQGLRVQKSNLDGNKAYRLMVSSVFFGNGQVLLPKQAPWLNDYISELLKFPNGKFDDQVDSTTQALLWQNNKRNFSVPSSGPREINRREFNRWR